VRPFSEQKSSKNVDATIVETRKSRWNLSLIQLLSRKKALAVLHATTHEEGLYYENRKFAVKPVRSIGACNGSIYKGKFIARV
jgi:hypothetical protein